MPQKNIKLTLDEIIKRLKEAMDNPNIGLSEEFRFPPGMLLDPPREAAVLVPFLTIGDDWHVLFTRRTATLPEHSGQVAFPGGGSETNDTTAERTALREAFEEIHLQPDDVVILGELRRLRTISNYCITPIVGAIPWPYQFKLQIGEVSRVFTIPLKWLASPDHHEIQLRELPPPYSPLPVVYFKMYDGELLWGVSAQITINLLKAMQLL